MKPGQVHVVQWLRCLHTDSPLEWADSQLLDRMNRAITDGTLVDLGGTRLEQLVEDVLVNRDQSFAYVVVNNIYRLVAELAIPLSHFEQTEGVDR